MTEEQAKGNAGTSEQHSLGEDQGSDFTAKGTKATQNGDIAAPTFGGLVERGEDREASNQDNGRRDGEEGTLDGSNDAPLKA
jgi:hypothetical protein